MYVEVVLCLIKYIHTSCLNMNLECVFWFWAIILTLRSTFVYVYDYRKTWPRVKQPLAEYMVHDHICINWYRFGVGGVWEGGGGRGGDGGGGGRRGCIRNIMEKIQYWLHGMYQSSTVFVMSATNWIKR